LPRDEHAPVNREGQSIKLALAKDIGERLASETADDQGFELFPFLGLESLLGVSEKRSPIEAGNVTNE
jgi:hypothetical protein